MKRNLIRVIALSAFALCFTNAALADEMVDNPNYKHWAQFKPGTFVTMKMTSEIDTGAGKQKTESTVTTKLKEVTSEKVVVTMDVVTKMGDQEFKSPPQEMVFPAKIKKEELDEVQKGQRKA
jgi:hypothetical protein